MKLLLAGGLFLFRVDALEAALRKEIETPSSAPGNDGTGAVVPPDLLGRQFRRLRTLPTGHLHTIADFRVRPPDKQHDRRHDKCANRGSACELRHGGHDPASGRCPRRSAD
jgi:hypothetical protein